MKAKVYRVYKRRRRVKQDPTKSLIWPLRRFYNEKLLEMAKSLPLAHFGKAPEQGQKIEFRVWAPLKPQDKPISEDSDFKAVVDAAQEASKPEYAGQVDAYEIKFEPCYEGAGVGAYMLVSAVALTPYEVEMWEHTIKERLFKYATENGKRLETPKTIIKDAPGGYKSIGVKAYFM